MAKSFFTTLLGMTAILHAVTFGCWQYRNPKANAMTCLSHYRDVMTWKKLAKFQ